MLKKWSPTLYRYALGCVKRYNKYISGEAVTNINQSFQDGLNTHEMIERYLITRNSEYLSEFSDAVKKDLDYLLSLEGNLYTEVKLEDEQYEGYADIVIEQDNSWIVIDVKNRYETTLDKEDLFQLYLYLYLLQKRSFKPEAYIGLFACHNNFKPLNLQKANHVDTKEIEKYLKRSIEHAQRNIETGQVNTSYCRYCQYLYSCDITKGEIKSIEDVARQYIHLKALIESYEQELRNYINETGHNIVIDNLDIGFHVRNKTHIEVEKLISAIQKNNIPFTSVFTPSATKVKQLAKKYDDIANCVTIEQDYEFSVKKIKEVN